MESKTLTAYCGLYCGDCPRWNAEFSTLAGKLLNILESSSFSKYAKLSGLEYTQTTIPFLKQLKGLNCEISCRQGGDGCGETACEIKKCIEEKALEGCWECQDFKDCRKMDFLKPFCGEAPVKNLQKVKKYGLDNWAGHREKQYPWL